MSKKRWPRNRWPGYRWTALTRWPNNIYGVLSHNKITEDSNNKITEDGNNKVLEENV